MTSRREAVKHAAAVMAAVACAEAPAQQQNRGRGSIEAANVRDFGALGDGKTDDTRAIQAALDSRTRGGVVYLPVGTYRIRTSLRIRTDGITLMGAGGHLAGSVDTRPTTIEASDLPSGAAAISAVGPNAATTMKHVRLTGLQIEMTARGGARGGAGIAVANCSNVDVEEVSIHVARGSDSTGLRFGDPEDGSAAVIASSIRGCTVVCDGTAILIGAGCTSISVEYSYALGATMAGIALRRATYCALTACAVDSGRPRAWGYSLTGCTGVVLSACGAESNGRGFVEITNGCAGVSLISCRGVANNASGDSEIGSFATISGDANHTLTFIGCVDSAPGAGTQASIRALPGTLYTTIVGADSRSFAAGVVGDATWRAQYATLVAGGSVEAGDVTVRGVLTLSSERPSAAVNGSMLLDRERYVTSVGADGRLRRVVAVHPHDVVQLGGDGTPVALPRMAAAALPKWSPALRGLMCWDVTNDRLVVYGGAARHFFKPSGTF